MGAQHVSAQDKGVKVEEVINLPPAKLMDTTASDKEKLMWFQKIRKVQKGAIYENHIHERTI